MMKNKLYYPYIISGIVTMLLFTVYLLTIARGFLIYMAGIPLLMVILIGLVVFIIICIVIVIVLVKKEDRFRKLIAIINGTIMIICIIGVVFLQNNYIFGVAGTTLYQKYYSNIEDATIRHERLRNGVANKLNLDIISQRSIPEVNITNRINYDDYTIDAFKMNNGEGYTLHGNIYSPIEPINSPAVLIPHGHFNNGRFNSDNQALAIGLAKKGCIAIIYDMVGMGEDIINKHRDKENNRIQTLNSIRVVDYIVSLPYVDSERIAVTGASGGGTQAVLLSVLDSRISVSVPVCMVSAFFQGGCKCENGYNVWIGDDYKTNNAELISIFAPKKLLLISVGTDWTRGTPNIEYPFIKSVYSLYGAQENVKNIHFEKEKHDYGYNKRKVAIAFLCECFNLSLIDINEENYIILAPQELYNFNE